MNLDAIDFSQCGREEKQLIEGFCLSFDLLRGRCLETLQPCTAIVPDQEQEPAT